MTPPNSAQGPQERTFLKSRQDSFDLGWNDFGPTIRLTIESVSSSSFTTMAEFIASPELDGTIFVCAGTASAKRKVLHLASWL